MDPFKARFKVALALILTLLVIVSCSHRGGAPEDRELLESFQTHREAFDKIQQMATEDARNGLYLDTFDTSGLEGSKFGKSRQEEYKKLISEIRPGLNITIDGHDKVVSVKSGGSNGPYSVTNFETATLRFHFAGEGSAIGPGWAKGIEFVPGDYRREGVILTNLDKANTLPANVYLQPIETNWFIFYQRDE